MQPALKSTYKAPPLLPGWTEHKAPTGHTYYYNVETKESTYKRPVATAAPPTAPAASPASSFWQHQAVPQLNLSDPNVANAFMSQYGQPQHQPGQQRGGHGPGQRGGFQARPKPQPVDKPRSKVAIPGHEPWILVYTKYGRRFAYNSTKNTSYWRIPEKLMPAILELDKARIRQKAEGIESDQVAASEEPSRPAAPEQQQKDYDSSEYEEVEVTDDEDGEREDDGHASKRQRTEDLEDAENNGPVEFTEADIAAQLAAMGADYNEDYEMGEGYDDYGQGEAAAPLSETDARELFKDMLSDFNINPYSPWDILLEQGKIVDDPRYTVLPTTKARKEVWEEWSRVKIQELKELRQKQEKKDPRIAYFAMLQEKATPKLYWAEFKRKFKREDCMKDVKMADKDREKWYREYISRLKLPQSALKSDLKKLLESVPLSQLHNRSSTSSLPPAVLTDLRYWSLDTKSRDEFVEGYIAGLGPPPDSTGQQGQEEDEATAKAKEERRKREKALQDRERAVQEEKHRQEKKLQFERARLREEERELERAMQVSKKGLQSQLAPQDA
ncbi:hypothetical protein QBC40DRAFT_288314 [Triangularia verruculosa]|uniref:WW domain-containing protein n=1 Tax=Triangularia verruculosa TaxID=2587418 RepID=A0AAN6XA64_9PEZI|nr:hypothetical protein QBC40DRAFT_288314 [Triangularia verruculosa]